MSQGDSLSLLAGRVRRYSVTSNAAAGIEGRMYPGNFDCEMLKNKTGTSIQISRKNCHESSGVAKDSFLSDHRSRNLSATARINHSVQGISASSSTGR